MSIQHHLPDPQNASAVAGAASEAIDSFYLAGNGVAMQRVRSQVQRIAPYFRMALITGEAGTGKETVARVLHAGSAGAGGPFVAWRAAKFVECLLGRDEGVALLQEAHGGTLFLEEIRGVPFAHQSVLLRMLQQQESRAQRYDIRIVAASQDELRPLMATGQFREDLYKRITAVEIGMTPLRRRVDDIATLATMMLRRTGVSAITGEALVRLGQHTWPGNVRELREVLELAAATAGGPVVEIGHLALPEERADEPEQTLERLEDVVQRHVLEVLTRCAGNKLKASEVLGISRSTLYRMLDARVGESELGG
ncbi:sigma-54-dependent transcriptional regulator [Granulicella arctica]|uniref:sigma-54-dependent transcriptional regulator n=1 Tax=Granulicella arctica TaxID=940613 RepID=UPI0021DF433D|nr:sigma 54-interacting transcriptional regulator [Granulicella arctica]